MRVQSQEADLADLAMHVLSWITFALRPLTLKELQHALAVELGESSLDEENIPDEASILSVCFGLISLIAHTQTVLPSLGASIFQDEQ